MCRLRRLFVCRNVENPNLLWACTVEAVSAVTITSLEVVGAPAAPPSAPLGGAVTAGWAGGGAAPSVRFSLSRLIIIVKSPWLMATCKVQNVDGTFFYSGKVILRVTPWTSSHELVVLNVLIFYASLTPLDIIKSVSSFWMCITVWQFQVSKSLGTSTNPASLIYDNSLHIFQKRVGCTKGSFALHIQNIYPQ